MSPGDAGGWIDDVFGRLATDGGFSHAEISEMTLDDCEPYFAHWKRHPPLRFLAEAWLGYKPPDDAPKQYATAEDMRRIMEMTGGRIPGIPSR